MNENIEKFILKLEPILNERDEKIKKREELIKDVNDFINLLPELNGVITDLEQKFLQTNDIKIKAELDSYLKERIVYYDTIKAFTKEALNIKEKLETVPEEIRDSEEKIIHLLYQRRELAKKIEYCENQEVLVNEEEKDYEKSLEALEKIDEEILKNYQFLTEQDLASEEITPEITQETEELLIPLSTPNETENLLKERDSILVSLKEIENASGRKITYKDTYQNQSYSKRIPRHLRGKYGILMSKLKKVEKILNKDYLPKIEIDGNLFDTMSKNQKIQYLANLMLQIEVFADKSLLPCIINGKKIPFEYKEIYEELVKNIKKLEQEKTSYYRYAIDWRAYEKLNVTEKLDYIDDLASKIVNNFIDNPTNILWNGKKYIVDQKDVPLFRKLIEMFETVQKECQDRVKEFEQKQEKILNLSTTTELETVSLNNELRTIPKASFKDFIQNEMAIQAMNESQEKIGQIIFDDQYYESLDKEEKINYCKNLINQIILKECKNPVKLFMDGQTVEIDSMYTEPFTKATSKLLEFKQENSKLNLDIIIDEDYVKTLSDEKKLEYYNLMIYDICSRPINEKMSQEIQGNIYSFDKKYALLVEVLVNRIEALREKLSRSVKVEKVEKPKKLDKIKKFLKKKAVQIALSVGALIAVAGMGYQLGKQNNNIKEEVVTEISKEGDNKNLDNLEPIIIDTVDTLSEDKTIEEKEELTKTESTFTLNENPVIYANTDLNEPLKPTYQNDSYRIVTEHYQMPDGTIESVNLEDNNSKEKINNIKASGGVLQSVSGVAKSGEEDYLENKIPTGVFDINSINLEQNLDNQELGGRSK